MHRAFYQRFTAAGQVIGFGVWVDLTENGGIDHASEVRALQDKALVVHAFAKTHRDSERAKLAYCTARIQTLLAAGFEGYTR